MRRSRGLAALALAFTTSLTTLPAAPGQQVTRTTPIALHPANPHYFVWRGRPTILITSGEHYGAVMNLDFDYRKYLDTLAADRLNYTRVFTGAYVEPQGAFKIERNTLAPRPGRFLAPWPRSSQSGYPNGGNKFDLSRWDDAYFTRLKDFIAYAAALNIVVELALFCPMYEEVQWSLSPMNAANNVNGVGTVGRHEVYTLDKDRGAPGRAGSAHPQAGDGAERLRQPVLRDRQRTVLRRRHDGLAAPHRRRDRRNRADAAREAPDRPEHRQQVGEDRRPASRGVDLQLSLRHAAGDRRDELLAEQGDRRRRDRVPRRQRRRLPDGRLGLRDRGRRAVQQPGLLVRRRLRGRHVPISVNAARRRQPGTAPAAEDPERFHQWLRLHPDDAGRHDHQGWSAHRRQRTRAGRAWQGNRDLHPETAAHQREGHCRERPRRGIALSAADRARRRRVARRMGRHDDRLRRSHRQRPRWWGSCDHAAQYRADIALKLRRPNP